MAGKRIIITPDECGKCHYIGKERQYLNWDNKRKDKITDDYSEAEAIHVQGVLGEYSVRKLLGIRNFPPVKAAGFHDDLDIEGVEVKSTIWSGGKLWADPGKLTIPKFSDAQWVLTVNEYPTIGDCWFMPGWLWGYEFLQLCSVVEPMSPGSLPTFNVEQTQLHLMDSFIRTWRYERNMKHETKTV